MDKLICNKCGLLGTTNKKESEDKHRKYVKGHEPEFVTEKEYDEQ